MNVRRNLLRLGLLLAVVVILSLGVVACTNYANPGGGGSPSSTPSSGGY